jgi:hypothetical protein
MTGIETGKEVMCETRRIFEESGFSVKEIADELAGIAFADMADFITVDESGIVRAIAFDELKKNKSRIIKKIKERRVIRTEKGTKDKPDGEQILDATFEFELHDKLDALGKAIAVIGIQKPVKVDVNHSGSLMAEVVDYLSNPEKPVTNDKHKVKKSNPKAK